MSYVLSTTTKIEVRVDLFDNIFRDTPEILEIVEVTMKN